jgi:cysteine desulfurase/selenocysteine lyase
MSEAAKTISPAGADRRNTLDVAAIRKDFPILARTVYDKPLVFLDNGASAQKPRAVIDSMVDVMERDYANIHRGVHYLSQRATQLYEEARKKVARFLNAPSENQIVFTGNATEAINLVAQSWGRANLKEGDEIVVSVMEHHANIVPWQLLETELGVKIRVAPIDDDGNFLLDEYEKLLGPKVRLVAVTHASNVLGTITPLAEIIRLAHEKDVLVCVDGAQGAVHLDVDVQALDADFYAFTGHKLYGPTGIGVLYGKAELLEGMPPWKGGGDMIASVSFAGTTFQGPPQRFEAGTPPIVEGIGLGAAIDYVQSVGLEAIAAHEHDLLLYATERLSEVPGLRIFGAAEEKCSIISFGMECAHPHDIGTIVDRAGVAVRTGHHCAQPLMERLGVTATARASFAMYNTRQEVDALIASLHSVRELFER